MTATSPSPDATRGPRSTSVSSLRPALAGTQPTVVSTEPWLPPLSRAYKAINLVGIVLPLAGLVIAMLLSGTGWSGSPSSGSSSSDT